MGKAIKAQPQAVRQPHRSRGGLSLRPLLGYVGLEGKLVFCLMLLVTIAVAVSNWLFLSYTSLQLDELTADDATELAWAMSLAAEPLVEAGDLAGLTMIGQELTRSRDVMLVDFYDSEGALLSHARRFEGLSAPALERSTLTSELMKVNRFESEEHGEVLWVVSPMLSPSSRETPGANRLRGYVRVGVSPERAKQQFRNVVWMVNGIGATIVLLCLPLASALVYQLFLPIRELLSATQAVAAGNLNARLALDRRDSIGKLARSFNEMVVRIKHQQDDLSRVNAQLATANWQLAEANRDLEVKVENRTTDLEQANRRLQHEMDEKEDFVRAVSHDLNAPLRNISGMVSLLLLRDRQKLDEKVIHRLERIKANVEHEAELINDLLELSRIKTRKGEATRTDTEALVHQVASVFENDLASHAIELVVEPDMPTVVADKGRLRQVFQNLIDNAIKYMGTGPTRRITIAGRVEGSTATFSVSDTGRGIHPDDLKKVFVVFRRGRDEASSGVAGKGVGLASVKSIVETCGGRIWVESQLGAGTTFHFTIQNRRAEDAGDEQEPRDDVPAPAQAPEHFSRRLAG